MASDSGTASKGDEVQLSSGSDNGLGPAEPPAPPSEENPTTTTTQDQAPYSGTISIEGILTPSEPAPPNHGYLADDELRTNQSFSHYDSILNSMRAGFSWLGRNGRREDSKFYVGGTRD